MASRLLIMSAVSQIVAAGGNQRLMHVHRHGEDRLQAIEPQIGLVEIDRIPLPRDFFDLSLGAANVRQAVDDFGNGLHVHFGFPIKTRLFLRERGRGEGFLVSHSDNCI